MGPTLAVWQRGSVRSVDYTNNIHRGAKRERENEEGREGEIVRGGQRDKERLIERGKETFIRGQVRERERETEVRRCGSREYQTRSLQSPLLIFITNNPLR